MRKQKKTKPVEDVKDIGTKGPRPTKDFRRGPQVTKPYIGPNDINWRTNDEVMTKLVASLPFGLAAGIKQPLDLQTVQGGVSVVTDWRQPGIMVMAVKLTAGNTAASAVYNSAANIASRKIYSYVRHANSGSKNYEAADMLMYFLAIGQCLGLLGWLQRVLRTACEYSSTNRYTPAKLLNAMGVNYADIIDNLPKLKYLIAWFGRAVGALAFPDLPYFRACYEAFKHIYVDNDSPKEQYYVINLAQPGRYNPTYTANGGGIQYSLTSATWRDGTVNSYMTFSNISSIVHEVMDVLLSDEDCGIISGDILKAFRDKGLYKVEAFGEDYELFIKSEEILQQIHNAHIIDESIGYLAGYKQNPGSTNTAPFVFADMGLFIDGCTTSVGLSHMFVIDAFSREPDAKEVVNCSVFNPVARLEVTDIATIFKLSDISFDLFLPVKIGMYVGLGASDSPINLTPWFVRYVNSSSQFFTTGISGGATAVTNFDWHPLRLCVNDSANPKVVHVIGDIQNFRFFTYEVGERIHENSMLALFAFNEHNFY